MLSKACSDKMFRGPSLSRRVQSTPLSASSTQHMLELLVGTPQLCNFPPLKPWFVPLALSLVFLFGSNPLRKVSRSPVQGTFTLSVWGTKSQGLDAAYIRNSLPLSTWASKRSANKSAALFSGAQARIKLESMRLCTWKIKNKRNAIISTHC